MDNLFYYKTKIGEIGFLDNGNAITKIFFGQVMLEEANIKETDLIKESNKQLQEYLNGNREIFDIPLEPKGTQFQNKVWKALQEIPYGETCSYKDIGIKIGNIKACRAVGMANNKNPLPIFIPCHRVIGSNGKLVGYAGGLKIKEKLLELEKHGL